MHATRAGGPSAGSAVAMGIHRGAGLLGSAWLAFGLVLSTPANAESGSQPPAKTESRQAAGKFVFELAAGPGVFIHQATPDADLSLAISLRLGGFLVPQVEMTGEFTTLMRLPSFSSMYRFHLVTCYYPFSSPGLYLLGGLGFFAAQWEGFAIFGFDLKGGFGYRLPLTERWSLSFEADWVGWLHVDTDGGGADARLVNTVIGQVGFAWR